MNLGDVLRSIGHEPIGRRAWTSQALTALNAILPTSHMLSAKSSGMAALGAISLLPEAERARLLGSEINLETGLLTFATPVAEAAPLNQRSKDTSAESFHEQVLHDLAADRPRTTLFLLAVGLVVVALIIATVVSTSAAKESGHQGFFEHLWSAIEHVIQSLEGNYQAPGN